MAEHELAHRAAERDVAQNLGAHTRVNLDALELLGCERLGLRENVLRYRHVADIVQQRRGAHCLHVAVGQAGRFGEHRRVLLDGSNVLGRAARLGLDRERQRFDGGQLHLHRAVRLLLLLAETPDDGVVAAEDQVQRRGEQHEPSEPAACRRQGREGGKRGTNQVARCAPQEVAVPDARHRLPRGQGDRAGDKRGVDEKVQRRNHRSAAYQRRDVRRADPHRQGEWQAGNRDCQRQCGDAEENAMQRIVCLRAQRALGPGADGCDADGQRWSKREQRPEVDHMRERQVGLAAAQRQRDLRRGRGDREPKQDREQDCVIEMQLQRRRHQTACAGGDDGSDVSARRTRQQEK